MLNYIILLGFDDLISFLPILKSLWCDICGVANFEIFFGGFVVVVEGLG